MRAVELATPKPLNLLRKLILNADDYGHGLEVNSAIQELAIAKRLGGVSVLANGTGWREAAAFLCSHTDLCAGIHFNAVEGEPVSGSSLVKTLTKKDGTFVPLPALLKRWVRHPAEVSRAIEAEWRAQIERLNHNGVTLKHADSHRHLHAFPPAYRCAVKLCVEYSIPALRWPWPADESAWLRGVASAAALKASLMVSGMVVADGMLIKNNQLLGFQKSYGMAELRSALKRLPPGVSEFVLHPSTQDGQPYAQLRGNCEREALLDDGLPGYIADLGIEMVSWEQLLRPPV